MKNYYSDLSLKLNFEIINKVKLAREASQENFAFLTTKYQQMAKAEHLICPKVGGGGAQTHFCPPPTFESAGAQAPAAPFSYALVEHTSVLWPCLHVLVGWSVLDDMSGVWLFCTNLVKLLTFKFLLQTLIED